MFTEFRKEREISYDAINFCGAYGRFVIISPGLFVWVGHYKSFELHGAEETIIQNPHVTAASGKTVEKTRCVRDE